MGQLRDWWPSDDALVKRSPPAVAQTQTHPSATNSPITTHIDPLSFSFLASPSPQARPIKLLNSQDHKQELLRNLLNPLSTSACDLPPSSSSPQEDNLLNPGPLPFASVLQHAHNKPSSLPVQDDISLSLFQRSTPSNSVPASTFEKSHSTQEILHHPINLSGRDRGRSHEPCHYSIKNKKPIIPEKTHYLHEVLPDSINKDLEKVRGSHKVNRVLSTLEKTHGLHDVQHHTINKESLSRREIHIFSERQRRKGMTHLYDTLLSLLPDAKPKTDRCKVLTDAMDYIQILREQVESLGCQKAELLASRGEHQGELHNTDYGSGADGEAANSSTVTGISDELKEGILSSADLAVRFCGRDVFVTLNSPRKKGVWSGILQILHEQEMEILNVTLSSGNKLDHHCIHARVSASSNTQSQEVVKMLQDLIVGHAILD